MYKIKAKQAIGPGPYGSIHTAVPKPNLAMESVRESVDGNQPRLKWLQPMLPLSDANHLKPMGPYIDVVEDISTVKYQENGFQPGAIAYPDKEEAIKQGKYCFKFFIEKP